jgi:hypothetical protein
MIVQAGRPSKVWLKIKKSESPATRAADALTKLTSNSELARDLRIVRWGKVVS